MKIITLTLSPALDVTYEIGGGIKPGLNRALSHILTPGGKGINVARAILSECEKCGIRADFTALFPSGGVTGTLLASSLDEEGIPTLPVKTEANCRINVSAISDSGDIEINSGGSYVSADELSQIEEKLSVLAEGDVLAICGSVPSEVERSYYAELIRRMKNRGVTCVLDCDGEAFRIAVCSDCPPDYVKPNEHEICSFCESIGATPSAEAIVKATRGKTTVIATYGGRGAALVSCGGVITAEATPVKPKRIKGAGDTLLGAFLYHKFVLRESDEAAISAAVKAAGEYVTGE